MKKVFCVLLLLTLLAALFVIPAAATGRTPDESDTVPETTVTAPATEAPTVPETTQPEAYPFGFLVLGCEVPEDFDKIICVSITDEAGNCDVYRLLPENHYYCIVGLEYGTYSVTASVNNDAKYEYIVLVPNSTLDFAEEEMEYMLRVSTLPGYSDTETTPGDTDETEPPTVPETTPDAPATSEPESEPSGDSTATEPSAGNESSAADGDKKSWGDILISLLGTAVFVVVIFLAAYYFRKYKERF